MAKPSGDYTPLGGFVFGEPLVIADRDNHTVMMDLRPQPARGEAWHLWTVFVPRRSITGRLVYGQVWRRHDGRHWKYKKFTEFRADRDQRHHPAVESTRPHPHILCMTQWQ